MVQSCFFKMSFYFFRFKTVVSFYLSSSYSVYNSLIFDLRVFWTIISFFFIWAIIISFSTNSFWIVYLSILCNLPFSYSYRRYMANSCIKICTFFINPSLLIAYKFKSLPFPSLLKASFLSCSFFMLC